MRRGNLSLLFFVVRAFMPANCRNGLKPFRSTYPSLEGVSHSDGGGCHCKPHLMRRGNLSFSLCAVVPIFLPNVILPLKRNDSVMKGPAKKQVKRTRPDFRHFTPVYYLFIALSGF